jgi:Repeat of unknown function (DUF5648)
VLKQLQIFCSLGLLIAGLPAQAQVQATAHAVGQTWQNHIEAVAEQPKSQSSKAGGVVTLSSVVGKQCYENYPEDAAQMLIALFPASYQFQTYASSTRCASVGMPVYVGVYTFDSSVRGYATDSQAAAELCSTGLFVCSNTPPPASNTVTVIEFYNTNNRHYFRTTSAQEAAGIDAGQAGAGWVRTGDTYTAYAAGTGTGNDVCRFYTFGANSHFYTAAAAECNALKSPSSGWVYEGLSYRIAIPNNNGSCAAGLKPVYRFFNNRQAFTDSNHRFSVSANNISLMQSQGWTYEGVAFCAL